MKVIFSAFTLLFFSTAQAATDLALEAVSYQYQGSTGYVNNQVCNNGTTPNANPRVHIRIMREGVWNVTEIQNIGNLAPQECYPMRVNYSLPQNQTFQLAVLLDPKLQLPDSDRSNNYVVADFRTPDSGTTVSQAVLSPSAWIDEFDEYKTTPVSAQTKRLMEASVTPPASASPSTQAGAFSDTQANTLEDTAAAYLRDKGIIEGYPDGEFKGRNAVNRAEVAKFLLLASDVAVPTNINAQSKFSDVPDGAWYTPFMAEAEKRGLLEGYPDGTFRPAQTVNTVEFLKLITKVFSLQENLSHSFTDVEVNGWYAPYVGVAAQYDLLPDRGNQLKPSQDLTRAEVAIAIYKVLAAGE